MSGKFDLKKFEIEAGKTYVLVFDQRTIKKKDLYALAGAINHFGAKGILVGVNTVPEEAVKIIEAPETKDELNT